ncbi:MAG: amidohydrolase [Leucobacter sp.]
MSIASTLILGARPVPAADPTSAHTGSEPVDLLLEGERVIFAAPVGTLNTSELLSHGRRTSANTTHTIQADGRWLIPGLWDHHVHLRQWSETTARLDLSGTQGPAETLERVARRVAELDRQGVSRNLALIGAGFRASEWSMPASVTALDAVTQGRPVALISGDAHSGWLNSEALALLRIPPRETPLDEAEWFAVFPRISELPTATPNSDELLRLALEDAASRGIVGITDFEFGSPHLMWEEHAAAGLDLLRVRAGFYSHDLDSVLDRRLRTGDQLAGRVSLGPLKIISDGSLGTLTAYCCEPYGTDPAHPHGKQNVDGPELERQLSAARDGGLEVALHAIGDRAVAEALSAFEATSTSGRIEHAQLMRREDVPRMARLGLVASVQPAHLLDDREVTERVWGDRADRSFMLRTMLDEGVELALGSDAPVAPLDPWLAIDAAVTRAQPGDAPWNPGERITAAEALFASTDGAGPVTTGSRGDVVLLDHDPLTARARDVTVAATILSSSIMYDGFSD